MSNNNQPKPEVIFLFGAGASVDAGIPDTYKFVGDFGDYLKKKNPDFHKALLKVLNKREAYNLKVLGEEHQEVDVEQLLDILRKLIEKNKEPLLEFYEEKEFSSDLSQVNFLELKNLLERARFERKKRRESAE